jgi:uncharacterized protein YfbU (UPF0304 family)
MAPKNERFEMRVDEDILIRVDKWRSEQGDVPSRAEAMRRLVELGLGVESAGAVRFSDGEKLIMFMLRDIYKHLKPARAEIDPDFVANVIDGGHYWAPKWVMPGVFHDHEDDPRAVKLVVDVLDMWSFLESGHAKLSKADKERVEKAVPHFGKHVRFMGFDGNYESAHTSIALFLVEKMERFTGFKGRDFNSHMPTLATYQRMLRVFEPIRRGLVGGGLAANQIIEILKAAEMQPA